MISPLPHGIANGRGSVRSAPGMSRFARTIGFMLTLGWKASAELFAPPDLLDYGVPAREPGFARAAVGDPPPPWRGPARPAPLPFPWPCPPRAATAARRGV